MTDPHHVALSCVAAAIIIAGSLAPLAHATPSPVRASSSRSSLAQSSTMTHLAASTTTVPAARPTRAATTPGSMATQPTATVEFRFDALRFSGQLSGPHALIAHGRRLGLRPPLLTLQRSFVHRVFETVEAPALAGEP